MNESIKILAAYDGSAFAENALKELDFLGIPYGKIEILMMEVAEVWLPPSNVVSEPEPVNFITEAAHKKIEENRLKLKAVETTVTEAAERLRKTHPDWIVKSEATYGSPAWELLFKADEFKPDLIVVGSHGLSALERLWIGSVSQKIVTEAECSVRVARGVNKTIDQPARIIVAYDGTKGADLAVSTVISRKWAAGSEVEVLMVEDSFIIQELCTFERRIFEEAGNEVVKRIENAGLACSLKILQGNPKHEIVAEAEEFAADCIFVGATKFDSKIERFLLGSVSSAITARAHCSVEVVRPNFYQQEK